MKFTDKIRAHGPSSPFFSFEFFPPRTDQGFENLIARISRLASLNPLAVSITWGAGGSTKDRSLDLAGVTQAEYGLDTILHLTCTNMEQGMVDDALKAAKARGVQNILALRGDPPRGEEQWTPVDSRFAHGTDLVAYIRSLPEYSSQFCIGVAAYPDGHTGQLHDERAEIEYLKAKVDAGADFIVTQLFYDVDNFLEWIKKVRKAGITVPIIPGIMPIQTYSSFLRLTKLCGTLVPESVIAALEPIKHDDQLVKDYGVQLAVAMIKRLTSEGGIFGVHLCTLNLEKSVQRVLEDLQWTGIGSSEEVPNKLIEETPTENEHTVTPSNATSSAKIGLANLPAVEGEAGRGELNKAASWDDFPNGRFGDFKSPAFGSSDQWGGPAIGQHAEVIAQCGHPKTLDDLTAIFLDYLHSKILMTPFSPAPLSPESLMILPHLERLTRRGWWTVGSQPAVDGASSSDEVVGWGPRAGYVFQKGFVEFFCKEEDVDAIERKALERGEGWVHWFAASKNGECRGNVPEGARNAVTWGVFPGQEIAQTTIIERESFFSWKDEAFSIWSDWASLYRPQSAERELLERVRDERWLVSIVHHDYRDPQALWTFVFDETM
ncbi:methylenetetrahydrofolate reductase-domain-containing protein [Roridomyces roridus]|uniref:Methylenetetrahydrofolate reductase-domain-containing protein n=1 Tax=Roridomyces roridus TaxID=1738132 RepID=A0AAD7FR55_9AGAR|nr:methylenetetrahydrofolate reductase-domain-containing protein [Roridomyces roridus]